LICIVPLFGLLVARGPVDGKGDARQGYWGAKTATVNWCESDYVVTEYIAEFGNSITSLSIIMSGLYGMYMHWTVAETRYMAAFLAFIVVGAGSFAFHATLWRSMQLLDELPMVWANSVFIYIVIAMEDAKERGARMKEIFCLFVATAIATLAVIFLDKDDQNVFLICYGSGVMFLFYRTRQLNLKYNSRGTVTLLESALLFYGGGFCFWLTDRNFCPHVKSLYLHCFWHFGAGVGTFLAVLCWMWLRYESLGMKPKVQGLTPATQWIEIPEKVL
jgi:dihydroceramidase